MPAKVSFRIELALFGEGGDPDLADRPGAITRTWHFKPEVGIVVATPESVVGAIVTIALQALDRFTCNWKCRRRKSVEARRRAAIGLGATLIITKCDTMLERHQRIVPGEANHAVLRWQLCSKDVVRCNTGEIDEGLTGNQDGVSAMFRIREGPAAGQPETKTPDLGSRRVVEKQTLHETMLHPAAGPRAERLSGAI